VVPLISAPPHRRIKILGQAATPPRRFSPARSFRLRLFQRGKLGHEEAARRVSQGLVGNIGEDHCQSALNFDPGSASNIDPRRRVVHGVHRGDLRIVK